MRRSSLHVILAVLVVLVGCQPDPRSPSTTEFSDPGQENVGPDYSKAEGEPLFTGQKEYSEELQSPEVPDVVRERLPVKAPILSSFQVLEPKFKIDVDNQTMTLWFRVESKRGQESLELKGEFKKSDSPWVSNLYAVDPQVLSERRVQARARCSSAWRCDVIAIDIYYEVDGVVGPALRLESRLTEPKIYISDSAQETPPPPPPPQVARPIPPPEVQVEPPAPPEVAPQPKTEAKPQVPGPARPPTPPPTKTPPATLPPKPTPPPQAQPQRIEEVPIVRAEPLPLDLPGESPHRIKGLPMPGPMILEQAVGFHLNGRLEGADFMPGEGVGFMRLAALTNRNLTPGNDSSAAWGTRRMIEYLTAVGQKVNDELPGEKLLIGNISQRNGGKLRFSTNPGRSHESHQNGLDVDLYFFNRKGLLKPMNGLAKNRLSADFDTAKNWRLLKILNDIQPDWVMVIFLNDTIKQGLCDEARREGEPLENPSSLAFRALRAVVPERDHQDHAHIRLMCPGNLKCLRQNVITPPMTTGCRPKK